LQRRRLRQQVAPGTLTLTPTPKILKAKLTEDT
jgi:hypothetical protein